MGQYWSGVIIRDKKPIVALSTYILNEGAKLMEHARFSSSYMLFWEELLGNEFYGDEFVWCGDYSEGSLYDDARGIKDSTAEKYAQLIEDINKGNIKRKYRYIVNISKKQYIDTHECENDLHPLPLLCANSNGLGGGDYYGSSMGLIGSWVGDKIGMSEEAPETFEKITPNFNEGEW